MNILNKYPSFQQETFIYIQPDKYILNQIQIENIISSFKYDIVLNEDAFKIIKNFNGKQKLTEILQNLKVENELEKKEILEFIKEISKQIEILFSKNKTNSVLNFYGDSNTYLPSVVSLNLTNKCNFRCNYCYNESSPSNSIYLKESIIVLKQLKELGVKVIELTGGEPFLHPEIKDIIKYVINNFHILAILSNGYKFDNEILQILGKNKNKVVLQISLDGSNEKIVDSISSIPGSFVRIVNNIKLAAKYGLNIRAAMTVHSPEQINDIENTLKLSKKSGCRWFGITHAINQGRAKSNNINKSGLKLTEIIEYLSKKYTGFFLTKPVEYFPPAEIKLDNFEHCGAGRRAIAVSNNNQIIPCSMSEEFLAIFGNIPNNDLLTIFNNKYYKAFSELEPPSILTCSACEHIVFCLGCLVRGLAKANDIGYLNCTWAKSEMKNGKKTALFEKLYKEKQNDQNFSKNNYTIIDTS